MNLNKAFVLGNLTNDPDKRSLPSGQPVVSFSVATNRFFTDQNQEKRQEVEYHNVVMFGRLAEIASQYLRKGSLVLVEGRIKTRNWDDNAGVRHYKTEVIAERMQLGPRATGSYSPGGQTSNNQNSQAQQKPSFQKRAAEQDIPVIEEEPSPRPEHAEESPASKQSPAKGAKEKEENEEEIDVDKIPF